VATETAPEVAFTDASRADLSFITETLEAARLDTENLQPEQFITVWRPGRIVGFGRIKPYRETYELGSVWVAEEERGKGIGAAIVRELIRRFPQDEVYITTDAAEGLPAYYEDLGFLRTQILPDELQDKIARVCRELGRDAVGMIYDRRIERLPTIADVYAARHTVEPHLQRTPLVHSPALSRETGFEAYFKLENLHPIGAFKVRGGVNLCAGMSEEERARGIIGASTGNHGQSLAYGARLCKMRCVIAMPEESNPMKVESMRALGAEVEFHGANFEEARLWAEDFARSEGLRYVHHINTPELIAGVATASLEVVEDLPDVDTIIVPIGGGSGALGHLIAAKALRPGVEVIGVQTAGAPAVYNSWRERVIQAAPIETGAEGLATGQAYYVAVKTLIDRIDDMVLVSEQEIHNAVVTLLRTSHVLAEESGAAATAAALQLAERLRGRKVAIIVSGGNITLDTLRRILLQATPG
jgi:threonine dehydratase